MTSRETLGLCRKISSARGPAITVISACGKLVAKQSNTGRVKITSPMLLKVIKRILSIIFLCYYFFQHFIRRDRLHTAVIFTINFVTGNFTAHVLLQDDGVFIRIWPGYLDRRGPEKCDDFFRPHAGGDMQRPAIGADKDIRPPDQRA